MTFSYNDSRWHSLVVMLLRSLGEREKEVLSVESLADLLGASCVRLKLQPVFTYFLHPLNTDQPKPLEIIRGARRIALLPPVMLWMSSPLPASDVEQKPATVWECTWRSHQDDR